MVSKISTPPGVKMYRRDGKRVYKWACSRTSATTAERVKTRAQNMQMYVRITARKLVRNRQSSLLFMTFGLHQKQEKRQPRTLKGFL